MDLKMLLGISLAMLVLANCSGPNKNKLTPRGAGVTFVDEKPSNACQLLGTLTGSQSNFFSGVGGENNNLRGAANDLRNRAAEMGGNVIFGASSPTQHILANFLPLDSEMRG